MNTRSRQKATKYKYHETCWQVKKYSEQAKIQTYKFNQKYRWAEPRQEKGRHVWGGGGVEIDIAVAGRIEQESQLSYHCKESPHKTASLLQLKICY